jgi:hypothetical protein
MQAVRVICPGCGVALSSGQAFTPGKLMDCPRCRLLFAPTPDDMSNPRGRGDEVAAERAWAEENVAGPNPSPSPYENRRRRYRWMTESEFGLVMIACVVMLVLGGLVVGTYLLWLAQRGQPSPAPVTSNPPIAAPQPSSEPAATPTTDPLPPVVDTEVEDNRPTPKKPVPRIENDDDGPRP